MKCPLCGQETDFEYKGCPHDAEDLAKEIERLKSIIGRSSDQIKNIKKTIATTWFEEQRLDSIGKILKEV